MNARMIARATLLVALLGAVLPHAAHARRVTFTRASILQAGVTRLSDLFMKLDEWTPQSADFYTPSPTPDGISLPRAPQWTVLLNGQRLDLGVFDAIHLDLAPVNIAEIDSVVVTSAVTAGRGWDAGRGQVEIFTQHARPGWTVDVAGSVGNETGDPGPYRATELSTPNVDAIAQDAALTMARGAPGWYARLSASMLQHPFTDPAMRERTTDALATLRPGATVPPASGAAEWLYNPDWPMVLRTWAGVRAGVHAGGEWHEASWSVSDARRYFHQSEPFGTEVPSDQRLHTGGITGGIAAGEQSRIAYRGFASQNRLSDRDGVLAFDYNWAWRRAGADVALEHTRTRTRGVAFAGIERRTVESGDSLAQDGDTFVRAGASGARELTRGLVTAVTIAGTFADGESAPSASLDVNWTVRPADTVRVRIAHTRRLFAEDDNLWLWSERGYELLADQGVSYTIDGTIDQTAVTSLDIGWGSRGVLGSVTLDAGLRRFDDAYVERRDFSFDPSTCTFASPTRIVTGRTGHVATVNAHLRHALGGSSWGHFGWTYTEEFDSDADVGALWQTVPRHHVSYGVAFQPRPTWGFGARLGRRSATTWPDYAGIDGSVCTKDNQQVVYHARVDAATTLDASLQHGMFGQHAILDVVARNVFNAENRYHPTGASLEFTVLVQLRVRWGN